MKKLKVLPFEHYASSKAKAFRHVKKYLKENFLEIPSTGEGMGDVIKEMTESGFYNFELIPEKPGYFRVIPKNNVIVKKKGFSYCKIIIIIILLCIIISSFFVYIFMLAIIKEQLLFVENTGRCDQMPCFVCTLFESSLKISKDFCNKCCF